MSKLQSRRNALRSLLAFPVAAKAAQEAAAAEIAQVGGRIGLHETLRGMGNGFARAPVASSPEDEIGWHLRDLASLDGNDDMGVQWYRDSLTRAPVVSPAYATMPSVSLAAKVRWSARDALASDTRKRREEILSRIARLKREHPMLALSAEVMRMLGGKV